MARIESTPKMRKEGMKFAVEIVKRELILDMGYAVNKHDTCKNRTEIRIKRNYLGKIGEIAFYKFLHNMNKKPDVSTLLVIFDEHNRPCRNIGETHDFITDTGKTIDVKTSIMCYNYSLSVPLSQLAYRKDFYVGVKIVEPHNLKNLGEINENTPLVVEVCGYCTYEDLMNPDLIIKNNSILFPHNKLRDIRELLPLFADRGEKIKPQTAKLFTPVQLSLFDPIAV